MTMQIVVMEKLHIPLNEANKLTIRQLVAYMELLKRVHPQDDKPKETNQDANALTVKNDKLEEIKRKSRELAEQKGLIVQ